MSAYKKIETKFKNLKSLIAALDEIVGKDGYTVAVNPKANTLAMYGYRDDKRPETAAINLPRKTVNRFSGGASNDMGFYWDEASKSYGMIVSDFDSSKSAGLVNKIKQQYAFNELTRQAKMKGYMVSKEADQSGVLRLKLKKY